MIDRYARDVGAAALIELFRGTITNYEFEERYPISESDHALWEIFFQVWFFYSDIEEHKLDGKHSLDEEELGFGRRCILFLESDLEFEWPGQKVRPWHGIRWLFFGFKQDDEELAIGDETVWPFRTRGQYEQMLARTDWVD